MCKQILSAVAEDETKSPESLLLAIPSNSRIAALNWCSPSVVPDIEAKAPIVILVSAEEVVRATQSK